MRETLHRYLLTRPGGATTGELLDLVFTQPGGDREFGPRFVQALLAGDPRFSFCRAEQRWVATVHAALARSLAETAFVVVDVETTGGAPQRGDSIIEIGAVRVEGARVAERFSCLVNPARSLPRFITHLTGITGEMLAGQPLLAEAWPAFMEFAGDRVLVAHNARFDLGFLNAAAQAQLGRPLHQPHLCTLQLARRLLPQLRRRGLDAVAAHFGIALVDRHRALGDALITAEILLHFLDLLAARGSTRLDQALALQANARDGRVFFCPLPRQAIAALAPAPGVYRFYGEDGRLLYIGKAKNLRQRVSQYLSNANGHSDKTLDLIRHIHRLDTEHAGSELEAALREAEAIRSEQPPYNRLHKHLPQIAFLKLTADARFPRLLATCRAAARGGQYFGPFRSRESALRAMALVARLFKLRTCAGRLRPNPEATPCLQGQTDACTAPCASRVAAAQYGEQVEAFRRLLAGDPAQTHWARGELTRQRTAHAEALRFEAAARAQRDLEELERLLKRQRTLGWVVAQHNFLVLQPHHRGGAALAYLVVSGRLIERRTLQGVEDLLALAQRVSECIQANADAPVADADVAGTTILAAWLRDRGERDGFVFRLQDASAASQQLSEWEAALSSILTQTAAGRSQRPDQDPAPP
ncbi:MAG: GIY-YIG nuclease family protein [Deltaproteobacteria bacterium]|nr:GIY-YIG nuclease family protein [Deltaproteobacteria bacterium]